MGDAVGFAVMKLKVLWMLGVIFAAHSSIMSVIASAFISSCLKSGNKS